MTNRNDYGKSSKGEETLELSRDEDDLNRRLNKGDTIDSSVNFSINNDDSSE